MHLSAHVLGVIMGQALGCTGGLGGALDWLYGGQRLAGELGKDKREVGLRVLPALPRAPPHTHPVLGSKCVI